MIKFCQPRISHLEVETQTALLKYLDDPGDLEKKLVLNACVDFNTYHLFTWLAKGERTISVKNFIEKGIRTVREPVDYPTFCQ